MKISRLLLALGLALPLSAQFPGFGSKKPKKEPEILIVSDTFGHESERVRPTDDNPITYLLFIGQ